MIKKDAIGVSDVHVPSVPNKKKSAKSKCDSLLVKVRKMKLDKSNGNHDSNGEFSSIAEESNNEKTELAQRMAQDNKSVDRNKYVNRFRGTAF